MFGNVQIETKPYVGAPQTVADIRRTALESQHHYAVRQLVERICQDLRSKDYLSEYLAINNFNFAHTRYMRDPRTTELVRAPYLVAEALLRGETPSLDCDDLTALTLAQCLAVGGHVRLVTVAFRKMVYRGEVQYSHVFAQALEPRQQIWVTLDPVAGLHTRDMHRRIVVAKVWPVA